MFAAGSRGLGRRSAAPRRHFARNASRPRVITAAKIAELLGHASLPSANKHEGVGCKLVLAKDKSPGRHMQTMPEIPIRIGSPRHSHP